MRTHLRTVGVVGLAAALMAWVFRSSDLASVWREIEGARADLILASVAGIALAYVVRVKRWLVLLAPLGSVGVGSATRATVIGFATSTIVPRLGEVVRPYLLARREELSMSAALATIVVERLLDMLAVILLFGLFLAGFSSQLPSTDEQVLGALKAGGLAVAVGGGAMLALVCGAARRPEWVVSLAAGVERLAPHGPGATASRFITRFSAGLGVARDPGRLLQAVAWSLVMWALVGATAWWGCLAFGIALPPSSGLLLMALMALGVAVPTPAGVGGFHAAVQVGLTAFYDVPADAAVGVALVLHAATFAPVTVVGLAWMARDGMSLRGMVSLTPSTAPRADAADASAVGAGEPPVEPGVAAGRGMAGAGCKAPEPDEA